ncbi:hypothetical protein B0H16DRAFT_1472908 [Mycena metata]|uniref:Uncharacterized protein n=1 Tax=Mycena metata TaxID=1033252 RepID=A0AAD7HMG6_9AGAR|nr:hypothetical protein B0H16DRAFT_1472908 [Mycena metata]
MFRTAEKTPNLVAETFGTFYSYIIYMYPSILFFNFGWEKAWAQARAQGFKPRTQGSGSGLENLKPEPAQAEPEPGHPGRAGPATSLGAFLMEMRKSSRYSSRAMHISWSGKRTDRSELYCQHRCPNNWMHISRFPDVGGETKGNDREHEAYISAK